MTISDEELDELKRQLVERYFGKGFDSYLAASIVSDVGEFFLSHYRSARNDALEEAATHLETEAVSIAPVAVRIIQQADANRIRALKSPPQSEPGTEDRGKER